MISTAIEEMAREQAKKDLKIIEFNFAALQNFIDEWSNCVQRMIEEYGNRITFEEFESIIHPKQHFPKPQKRIIPKYTEPFRNVRRIARSDCK